MDCLEKYGSFDFGKYTVFCDRYYNGYIQEYSYFISVWDNDELKDYCKDFKNMQDCIKYYEKMAYYSVCYPMQVLNAIKDIIKSYD